MFLKRRISTTFLVSLVLSVIALSFFIVTPKVHAEVTVEELGQLQAQVDVITQVVQKLTATNGQVLGVSTSLPVKYFETTVIESGDKRALSPDGSWWQGGKEMQKKRILMQIETHKKQIALLEAQLKKLDEETSSSSTPSKTFTIDDVKSVKSKYVDPDPKIADEEYTLYTIVLKNGKTIEVKQCGYCSVESRDKAFKAAGYKGDVAKLRSLALTTDSSVKRNTYIAVLKRANSIYEEQVDVKMDVTKAEAEGSCRVVFNDYKTHNFSAGDVLTCFWAKKLFMTVDEWKG